MLKLSDFLYFYRILNWENKVSGLRPIGYTIFGYLILGKLSPIIITANTLANVGALTLCYAVNDYFDWKIQKERSFLAQLLQKNILSEKKIAFYLILPSLLFVFLYFVPSRLALVLFFINFFLVLFYSLPPIRLKSKPILGIVVPPIGVTLLFLQAYISIGDLNQPIFLLAILILLFQLYLETFHMLEDSLVKEEVRKIKNVTTIIKILKIMPIVYFLTSLFFAFLYPIFLISTFFSLLRTMKIWNFNIEKIRSVRRNFFSIEWSLYEFAFYGTLGILHKFN